MCRRSVLTLLSLVCLLLPVTSLGQVSGQSPRPHAGRPLAANVVIPQRRALAWQSAASSGTVQIERVDATITIVQQVATTTLEIALRNPTSRRLEAEVILPVPDGAAVRGFDFQGSGAEPSAELLPRDEARRIYDSIVAKIRDPALLEFIGYNLIRSSVFPVDPQGTQRIRLAYEHVCPADGNRIDYVLPRSEALDCQVPWSIRLTATTPRAVSTVYSPSHAVDTQIRGGRQVHVQLTPGAAVEPGPFRLSLLLASDEGVSATLLACPDPQVGGGYFLLLAGVPEKPTGQASGIRREVTLVLDRSGSMNGDKLRQVREAALQIIAGLEADESFNIIVYNESVDVFSTRPVSKSDANVAAARRYLRGMLARGGTNIHDALVEALRQKPTKERLPMVLFLTDGRPTIGQSSERAIREVAKSANPHNKRVFTFGVGVDVNSPLLENIAWETRATSTFVLPNEDVEAAVAGVFRRLNGPVLADPELTVLAAGGEPAVGRTRDLIPARLPDLFQNDQLLLLGQYVGEEPLAFRLAGNYRGQPRTFRFQFRLDNATTRNSFVPRLWAQRKIGLLIDAIRSIGADTGTSAGGNDTPRVGELVDQVVRLSTEFGILTEYTAFLAREGTDLARREALVDQAWQNFDSRAVQVRSGLGAVNQELNTRQQKTSGQLNYRNTFWDAQMNRVEISAVQQVADRAFYRQGDRWIDSRLVNDNARQTEPDRVIQFGSPEFLQLAHRLAAENRQASLMMSGQVLLDVDGQSVLVRNE
jgi:Ca-activated chloride channel family protein